VLGHLDGCLDVLVLAAEDRGRLQLGVGRMNLAASDALADVRRDAWADGFRELQRPVADAGKSAGLELACPEPDVLASDVSVVRAVVRPLSAVVALALEAPGKPGAAPSGARSCADPALAGEPVALRVFELGLDSLDFELVRPELTVQN
jgi:hypothetical protein